MSDQTVPVPEPAAPETAARLSTNLPSQYKLA